MANPSYKSFAIAVTASAQRVRATNLNPITPQAIIKNNGTTNDIIYIGGSDVTTSNGYPVAVGDHISVGDLSRSRGHEDFDMSDIWIVGSGNIDARVLYAVWG